MDLSISVEDFLERVNRGDLSKLETYSYIDKVTDNFRVDKLVVFLEDIDETIRYERIKIKSEFAGMVPLLVKTYRNNGMEIPYTTNSLGKKEVDSDVILRSTILSSIYCLLKLKQMVESLINKINNAPSVASSTHDTPPNFLKGIDNFLNEKGIKNLPIIENVCKQKAKDKKDYVSILFALDELNLLNQSARAINRSAFHKALVMSFGEEAVGKIANFNRYFTNIDPNSEIGKSEIAPFKIHIQSCIDKNTETS